MEERERGIVETVNYSYEDLLIIDSYENRELYLDGEINQGSIQQIIFHINRYNRIDKDVPEDVRVPIILYINSPGGDTTAGFSVVDMIVNSKTPVYTVNLGMCDSMAFYIFIAGAKRYSMPHSEFLLHDGSTVYANSTAKVKDRVDFEMNQLEKMFKEHVLKYTYLSSKEYDKNYRKEYYFLPKEAKEIGALDYIIGEDCNLEELFIDREYYDDSEIEVELEENSEENEVGKDD